MRQGSLNDQAKQLYETLKSGHGQSCFLQPEQLLPGLLYRLERLAKKESYLLTIACTEAGIFILYLERR